MPHGVAGPAQPTHGCPPCQVHGLTQKGGQEQGAGARAGRARAGGLAHRAAPVTWEPQDLSAVLRKWAPKLVPRQLIPAVGARLLSSGARSGAGSPSLPSRALKAPRSLPDALLGSRSWELGLLWGRGGENGGK